MKLASKGKFLGPYWTEFGAASEYKVIQKSRGVLAALGPSIQWLESFVTDDKIYCVYIAPNEQMVRRHAEEGGFPANRISEVRSMISPVTAEPPSS